MNKNTTIAVIAASVAAVIIVALIVFVKKPAATTTPNSDATKTTTDTSAKQPGAPVAVTNESVVPDEAKAMVTGTVNPNGVKTNYWYEYGTTESLGSKTSFWVLAAAHGHATVAAPGIITGLTKNTLYYYRLVAENEYGKVPGVRYTFKTTNGPMATKPTVVTEPATAVERMTAVLNAKVTPNNDETVYWFEYGTTAEMEKESDPVKAGEGTTAVSVSLSLAELDPATTYYYVVVAKNQFGTAIGKRESFTTKGPAIPTAPIAVTKSAKDIKPNRATVQGTVNPKNSETKYWFEYSTDSLLGSVLLRTTPQKSIGNGHTEKTVMADITNLVEGSTYYYRLVAQNGYGIVRGDKMSFKTE